MEEQNNRTDGSQESAEELLRSLGIILVENRNVDHRAEKARRTEETPVKVSSDTVRKSSNKTSAQRSSWLIICHDLVYILAIVALAFTFFIRVSRVEGDSMNPTFVNHDSMLLLSNVWYSTPQRGDIVVARVPAFSKDPIVKRIIAVEGDTVDIDFDLGIVYVNGEALSEPYIKEPTHREFAGSGITFPMVIEKNHVFLMGDNRNDSYDSRYGAIGQVDERCILGKAFFLISPGINPDTDVRDYTRVGVIE